jgi:DNA-binding response OmpR family regulator
MKILVVENDGVLTGKIETYLKTEGHWCEVHASPMTAQAAATAHYYDAIVLNLIFLAPDELAMLRFLRNARLDKKTILTFEPNTVVNQNKVDALEMANLQKPYTLPALYEKITTIIHYENLEGEQTIYFNELQIDVPGRTVRVKDSVLQLTRREYDLLLYLVTNKSQVLSKNTLAQYLAKESPAESDDFGFLYAHIKNLKKKLKAAGANDYIKTVYGIGYRFDV